MTNGIADASFWQIIVFAVLCGTMIGLERQIKGKTVGIRTSILVCLGTAIFVYLGGYINEGRDQVRILGQVVTGIGFLGAGVIMNKGGPVSGVTSAAVIWILAGAGAAIGLHRYEIALVICLVALTVLIGVEQLEKGLHALQKGEYKHHHKD